MENIKLRKANKIVRVSENELDKYLSEGYERLIKPVIQEEAKPVEKTTKTPAKRKRKTNQ